MRVVNCFFVLCCAVLIVSVGVSGQQVCPCLHSGATSCSCMRPDTLFKTDEKVHGAPVLSVAWLCDGCMITPSFGGAYAAVGGYSAMSDGGSVDVRVYTFNALSGRLGDIDSAVASHGNVVTSVSWCCIPDHGAYLAVGGYPEGSTGQGFCVRVYHFDGQLLNFVAGFAHGAPVHAVSWLCNACAGRYFLAIGGDAGLDGKEIRMLEFTPETPEVSGSLKQTDSAIHGAPIYALDFCCREGALPLLAAGGAPEGERGHCNIRIYTTFCDGGFISELTNARYSGSTVYALTWCCEPNRCPRSASLAVSGSSEGDRNAGINVRLYCLNPRTCRLNECVGYALPEFKGFAVAWNPLCNCTHVTVGGACGPEGGFPDNILVLKVCAGGESRAQRLERVTGVRFDENITSLSWCHVGGCMYLLVGSENARFADMHGRDGMQSRECKIGPDIAVYKGLFCVPGNEPLPPMCAPTGCFDPVCSAKAHPALQ